MHAVAFILKFQLHKRANRTVPMKHSRSGAQCCVFPPQAYDFRNAIAVQINHPNRVNRIFRIAVRLPEDSRMWLDSLDRQEAIEEIHLS